ncbi:hypothetical protein ACS0TY_022047 [Phlomoides rotata]
MSSSHSQLPHVSTSRISASQLLHQSPPTGHRSPPAAAVQQPPWAASGSCVTSLDVQQHLSPSPTYSHRSRRQHMELERFLKARLHTTPGS